MPVRLPAFALLLLMPLALFAGVSAQELPKPAGKIILTISGKISQKNAGDSAVFDRAALESIGKHVLLTTTNWTDGVKRFEGVLMRDLLARVGASGVVVSATALNDYTVDIPVSDFQRYDVLLAFSMDGKDLQPSDKGPLWIVYPRDRHPELNNAQHEARWIWQLRTLTVR
ncbi:molybdopterin-dependent oxidoreductase [Microvirga flavescens]|uniref:molybdopterin-dependent oxidoreductase n=1 Tax=Microvirga flavescens TaxID=2249811 RepID=UPI0018E0AFA3|nr:molybdopterin-dependent oxidoreductase [Microvirga flavescens]